MKILKKFKQTVIHHFQSLLSSKFPFSWNWGKLLKLRDMARPLFLHIIWDGKSTTCGRITDTLMVLSCLDEQIGLWSSLIPTDAKVETIINGSNWAWLALDATEIVQIQNSLPSYILNPQQMNKVKWLPDSTGSYSAHSTWKSFCSSDPKVSWHKLIWFPQKISRMSFVL